MKQDVRSVNLDKFLLGMLPPPFWGHAGHSSFNNFQQRLLYSLSRNISGNRRVVAFAGDFVDLIDIDNPFLTLLDIIVGILQ